MAFLGSPAHARGLAHELESVGTMRLLNAARQTSIRKLVMWSQTLLYGAHPTNPNFLSERHPLRAPGNEPFFMDKVDAEAEANRFAERDAGVTVTVLRTAPIVGPTVRNYVSRYLARRFVPTMMGYDPLVQFLHEADAVAAFKLAIFRDVPGTFNIVGDGVLPLSTVIKLAGRAALPIPHPLAAPIIGALWLAQVSEAPPGFLDYLRYVCVADGEKAAREMGFTPAYTTREALTDFTSAQRLRDVKLLNETPA
jgi:UDP-glucose 4-epimerase